MRAIKLERAGGYGLKDSSGIYKYKNRCSCCNRSIHQDSKAIFINTLIRGALPVEAVNIFCMKCSLDIAQLVNEYREKMK